MSNLGTTQRPIRQGGRVRPSDVKKADGHAHIGHGCAQYDDSDPGPRIIDFATKIVETPDPNGMPMLVQVLPHRVTPGLGYYLHRTAEDGLKIESLLLNEDRQSVRLSKHANWPRGSSWQEKGDYPISAIENMVDEHGNVLLPELVASGGTNTIQAYMMQSEEIKYLGQHRDCSLILEVATLPSEIQRRLYVGLTGADPSSRHGVRDFLRVLHHANEIDPKGSVQIIGGGELTLRKEGVTCRLGVEPTIDPGSPIDQFLELLELIGNAVALIHCDAGRPKTLGNLLVHGVSDDKNVSPLLSLFRRHPKVQIIWAHWGGLGRSINAGRKHAAILRHILEDPAYGHVMLDTSWDAAAENLSHDWFREAMVELIRKYPGRFIYGSDAVATTNTADYEATLEQLVATGLLPALGTDIAQAVLTENFQRIMPVAANSMTKFRLRNKGLLADIPSIVDEAFLKQLVVA